MFTVDWFITRGHIIEIVSRKIMTDVGDHYRPIDDTHEQGVYRVVGKSGGVTLLRITDADGQRIHSGEIRRCSRDALAGEFRPVKNPDAGFTPVSDAQNALSGLYWSVRRFL